MDLLNNLKRRLERTKAQLVALEARHKGKEDELTYWAGHDMGYLKARVSMLEDEIDYVEDQSRRSNIFVDLVISQASYTTDIPPTTGSGSTNAVELPQM